MNLIDRYLGKAILQTIFIVLFAIAGIEIFIMMIAELGSIGHNQYTIVSAIFFVLLNLPDQIYQLFPMAGLIGMLMAFGLLANHSELIVMQSAGMSPLRITLSALKTIIALLIIVSLIGEVIAPKASEYANNYKAKLIQNANNPDAMAYDLWLKVDNDYIHVKQMDKQNALHGVSWYHFDNQNTLLQANLAMDAQYVNGQWLASKITQTIFTNNSVHTKQIAKMIWPFNITPNVLLETTQSPNDLSLKALHQSLQFHQQSHTQNDAAQLSFWRRVLQPAASLVMMLLAIPFIFGPLRHTSNSLRLVIGIVVGFCFYYMNQFFGPIVLLFHWPPLLGAVLPTFLFGIVGIVLLKLKR